MPQLGRVIIQDGVTIGANSLHRPRRLRRHGDRREHQDRQPGADRPQRPRRPQLRAGRPYRHLRQRRRSATACMFGGRAGVADHLTIGAGARIAAAAGVMKDVPAGETWGGIAGPADPALACARRPGWRETAAGAGRDGTNERRRAPASASPTDIDIAEILRADPAPLSVPAGRPGRGLPAAPVDRRHQVRDDERAVLPGPLPGQSGDAGRADRRGHGPDRRGADVQVAGRRRRGQDHLLHVARQLPLPRAGAAGRRAAHAGRGAARPRRRLQVPRPGLWSATSWPPRPSSPPWWSRTG